jgi:hypothetical protein
MIVLKEIIHSINKDKEEGLVNIDDWRFPDVDHLSSMGFDFDGDFRMSTNKEPHITVYKKKDGDTEKFYVEEKGKDTRRFKEFNEVIDYFDTYSQPEIDKLK